MRLNPQRWRFLTAIMWRFLTALTIFYYFIAFAWKAQRFAIVFLRLLLLLLCHIFPEYRRIRSKKIFLNRWAANAIQLFVAIKGNFSGPLFFRTSRTKGKFPRDYLTDVVTCLFACKIDIKLWTKTCPNCQNLRIKTNNPCCNILIWASFCFL